MKRAVMIGLCGLAMLGCARMREIQLPAEQGEQPGLEEAPAPPSEVTPVENGAAVTDPACETLAHLSARDGSIEFHEDGGATITVSLVNESDVGVYDYPGLDVWWEIPQRYAGGNGELFLYGLAERDSWEHTIEAPAEMLQQGVGQELIVHAEPFTLGTRDVGACEATELVFSAVIP